MSHEAVKLYGFAGRVKMARVEIRFYNKIGIRTLAQIFVGQTLVSSGMVDPGESCVLSAETGQYDIFIKHGMTGRELVRILGGKAKRVTLSEQQGRYIVK